MRNIIWWAAIATGAAYMLPVLMDWHGPVITAWKGLSVGLLALWAAMHARDMAGWTIAAILAFGSLGDVVLNVYGLKAGAVLFVLGHLLAITFFLAHRREQPGFSQRALAMVLPPAVLFLTWRIAAPHPDWPIAAGYATIAACMAAAAWLSRFPRYRTGVGAVLFVVSDLAIFAGEAGMIAPEARRLAVWPLYFSAQALIATGVVTALDRRRPSTASSAASLSA